MTYHDPDPGKPIRIIYFYMIPYEGQGKKCLLFLTKYNTIIRALRKRNIVRGVAQMVARHVRDVEAAGSNPVTPIKQ